MNRFARVAYQRLYFLHDLRVGEIPFNRSLSHLVMTVSGDVLFAELFPDCGSCLGNAPEPLLTALLTVTPIAPTRAAAENLLSFLGLSRYIL